MINRNDIEAGDKCYTRDGGCLVAREGVSANLLLGSEPLNYWEPDGQCTSFHDHPLDIIRIEKAPKPVAREIWVGYSPCGNTFHNSYSHEAGALQCSSAIKLTIINGKLEKAEQVK